MSSMGLLNELSSLCVEIRAEKVTTRNKAAERLDNILTNSKPDLISLFKNKLSSTDISYKEIFNSSIYAVLKHAARMEESQDLKSIQTMRNRNYMFTAIVSKLIDYDLEDQHNFLSNSVLLSAFFEGFGVRSALKHFGTLLLYILDTGIYKSEEKISQLKVNDLSRILSYLFEVNIEHDVNLNFSILRSITKTIELSERYVQLSADLIEYLPDLLVHARSAIDERYKAEVIKLFYLFLCQLSIDYHNSVCANVQEVLPIICGFYTFPMKTGVKQTFFSSVIISLTAIYPHVKTKHYSGWNEKIVDIKQKTFNTLETIIEMEIKGRHNQLFRSVDTASEKCFEAFIKMSTFVIYLMHWHIDSNAAVPEETIESRRKVKKIADKMEIILDCVKAESSEVNENCWLAILAELLNAYEGVLNINNYQEVLQTILQVFNKFTTASNLKNLRLCCLSLLRHENVLIQSNSIPRNYYCDIWAKVVEFLLSETSANNNVMNEKQLLLQALVLHNKLTSDNINNLLHTFVANKLMRCTECIATVREILKHANNNGLNKTSEVVICIINWLCESNRGNIDAKSALLNIAPIHSDLIVDTCVIAVINFMGETFHERDDVDVSLNCLLYKYNRKYVCIEEHGKEMCHIRHMKLMEVNKEMKNCLFQNNYELLMRLINFQTTKETSPSDICMDLSHMHLLISFMKKFIEYYVFTTDNYSQCPLIKRIGFFLSHLEFQLKNTDLYNIDRTDLLDILQGIEGCFLIFSSNEILLNYLEAQPLEELIIFLEKALKLSVSRHTLGEFEDWLNVKSFCLKILASLCASTSHLKEAFAHIFNHKFNIKSDLNTLIILIKILSVQKHKNLNISVWFVDRLKMVCQLYHNNIEISMKIVDLLPDIFTCVQYNDDCLEVMLIVLSSFIKKAYKKSYSTHFAATLLKKIRLIAKNCGRICNHTDFRDVFISITKFICSPSLEVQFAAINTITAMMDFNWFASARSLQTFHAEFCSSLMSKIDYKNLPTITPDNNLNTISVTSQLLIAIFIFSSYHQEIALQELVYFCALQKLNPSHFFNLQQVPAYLGCSLSEMTSPYVPNLIHTWTENKYPITKFPYFLCESKKEDFELKNISLLTCSILTYSNIDEIKKFEKYRPRNELIDVSFSKMIALTLPYLCGCSKVDSRNYTKYITNLINNMKLLGIDIHNKSAFKISWHTICSIMALFTDDHHFENMFGFLPCSQNKRWFNIEINSLLECLSYYIENCGLMLTTKSYPLLPLISQKSIILVQVFISLKEKFAKSFFLIDKLKSFHLYCTFAQFVIEAIEADTNVISYAQNCKRYFIRDIMYYMLHVLQESQGGPKIQQASLAFIQKLFSSSTILAGLCNDIIRTNLSYILRSLVPCAEKSMCSDVRKSSLSIIYSLIDGNKDMITDAILYELPKCESFDKLREIQLPEDKTDIKTFIKNLLEIQCGGSECIKAARKHIARNKSQLRMETTLIYDLIKSLIETIRNPKSDGVDLEAAKCLGEIGPLKLTGFSFYFETDVCFYISKPSSQGPRFYFTECLLTTIEKMFINYNEKTHSIVCNICQQLVSSKNGINLLDTFPYMNVFRSDSNHVSCLDIHNENPIDLLTILKLTSENTYELWICSFVSKLYAYFGWNDFKDLSLYEITFAESSLVPIFKLLLSRKELHLEKILTMLKFFFDESFRAIDNNMAKVTSIYREKRAIKHFLNICECIRIYNEWNLPTINLLYVAKICNYCQAYFLSILYLEMFSMQEKYTSKVKAASEIITNELFQEVSIKAYKSIGYYDVISSFLNPLNHRLEFLSIEGTWSDVLLQTDATENNDHPICVDKLKMSGLFSLVNRNQTNKSIEYESCWRLCQWNTIVEGHSKVNSLNDMEQEYKKHHFNSLKCIFNREEINSLAAIRNARKCVVLILKEISVDCLQSVYKYLTWLQLLQQVEDFCQVQFSSSTEAATLFDKWKIETDLECGQFWCKELILSHQITLFRTAGIRANRKIKEYFKDNNPVELHLLKSIKTCKKAGEINFAIRNIAALKSMPLLNVQIKASVLLEDAEVCFRTGKSEVTKAILEHVIKNKEFVFCPQRVKAYRMHGEYLMESNAELFETVLKHFFNGSIDLLNQFAKNKDTILLQNPNSFNLESFDDFERKNHKYAYEVMAKYADREYNQLNIYSKSDEFHMKCKIIQESRQAVDLIGRQDKDRDKNIGAIFMKKFANLDEKEVNTIRQKCTEYLCIAVDSYIKFCKIDQSTTSPAIYRIIALWFANKHNKTLHLKVAKDVIEIPSYKFLCALNQMTARLNSKHEDFLLLLRDILVKCLQDHPHHTLYQLFPLVYADNSTISHPTNQRIKIARDIINKAKNTSNNTCIKQLENMFPALIEYSNEKVPETNPVLNDKLRRLKNLEAVHCPTIELPIAINRVYKITSIIKWDDKVSLVGGINAPKKLTCLCSDGVRRPQLLKGKDDLRQDAVMQQVFSMINDLLNNAPETSQHQLKLRTYKVVPLSMRSGILEWCENTIPIGIYLTGDGKTGAHKKYRPNDYNVQKCRSMSMQHLKSDIEKRLQTYLHICSNIKPVFHYFFFERFLVPGEWFERRLAYVNSVATTSIVGYILGLGDRHTQNILIDEKTAEVIHIDFGIAFEQGRIMPTPETVPFRLTRDMVAPMGVCETNGVFKKSCEKTMRILRRNQEVINTILEVLLHDPLYIWKVVPQATNDNQHEVTNLTAQRAILCVQNKLEGKQAGIFGTSDIDVQVHRLINEATLNQNLCLMYPGWDPYL